MKNLIGVILAGGQSQRMGSDKALLCYHGKPQVDYLAELLSEYCSEVVVSGQVRIGFEQALRFIPDTFVFEASGPIGGVLTVWEAIGNLPILVVGCDYPFIDRQTLDALLKERNPSACATAFKHTDGTPEPLLTLYEPRAHEILKSQFKQGKQSLKHFLLEYPSQLIVPHQQKWLTSVDTPDQQQAFELGE